jgi:hypothetical protein
MNTMTPPCPAPHWINGWQQDVWTLDDEAFRELEQPQARMVWDALTPLEMCAPVFVNKDTYPMLTGFDAVTIGERR